MESHNSCEKLVAAEAGLESLKTPEALPFVRISRRKGGLGTFVNYLFILFAITLLSIISWEIWQMVRSEKLMKEIEIQNTHKKTERLLMDERFEDVVEQLNRVKSKLAELQENYKQRDLIPPTTESPIKEGIQSDIEQYLGADWLKSLEDKNKRSGFRDLNLNFPTLKAKEEDVSLDLDDYGSSMPVTIGESIEEPDSGVHWIFEFNFGGNSGEDDTSEESHVTESKETEAILPVEKETSEEGWTGYIPRVISTPFKKPFGISWGWGSSIDEEDSQSSESAEEVEENINITEIEPTSTTVAPTTDSFPENYDEYYDYDSEYGDYGNSYAIPSEKIETSSSSPTTTEIPENVVEMQNPTAESSSASTVQENFEEIVDSTTTQVPRIFDDDADGDFIKFWSIFNDGPDTIEKDAEDRLKSIEEFLEESASNQESLLTERIDRFFEDLAARRIAEAAFLDEQYSRILEPEQYSDDSNEEYYGDENANFTEQPSTLMDYDWNNLSNDSVIPADTLEDTEALVNVTTESSLGPTIQEDSEEVHFSTTEDPQVSEPSPDDKPLEFPALYYPGVKSPVDSLEESQDFWSTLIPFPTIEEDIEYTDRISDEDGWSYISKRSVDTPSAPEAFGEQLSAKEFGHKIEILQQAIDDENHLLQNEVSLTSGPTKQFLQSKLNNFYSKMERISTHIDRLHERYLKLNKLDDDYVSRELPVEEEVLAAPRTPIN